MERIIRLSSKATDIAPGWKAKATPIRPFANVIPRRTSIHEARHAVLNPKNTKRASRIPGQNYSGITEIHSFDPVAAMGPHSMGDEGTGYDVWLVTRHGYNPDSIASIAKNQLIYLEEEANAVARSIEANGTISGYEIEQVIDQVRNPVVEIEITNPLGQIRHFAEKTRKGQEYLTTKIHTEPSNRLALAKAA